MATTATIAIIRLSLFSTSVNVTINIRTSMWFIYYLCYIDTLIDIMYWRLVNHHNIIKMAFLIQLGITSMLLKIYKYSTIRKGTLLYMTFAILNVERWNIDSVLID